MNKVLLIDGMNAIHRANISFSKSHSICNDPYHPDRHPTEPHCVCGSLWKEDSCYGEEFYIVYNFFRNLRPIIELFSPDKCFFVLEGHPQFRYDLFTDYKANRIVKTASKADANVKFYAQTNIILNLLQYLPITIIKANDYEADDVIGTLCENMKDEQLTVLSSDSDHIQLLQKKYNINVYNPIKKENMVAPDYPYVIWKCLNGDKSDNIPSLLKPKKALETATTPKLFKDFLNNEENKSKFSMNRQLIEFRNVPEDNLIVADGIANYQSLKDNFNEMKFSSITNDQSWNKYVKTFECMKF